MGTEKLKFKLELFATMWDKPPHVEISVTNELCFKGDIEGTETKPNIIEFERNLEENKTHNLILNRLGKTNMQTVVNEKGDILNDQLLNIKKIEIDDIDIGALIYEGNYTPDYPEPWFSQQKEAGIELPKTFKSVTEIGHNGIWNFEFKSPFYMWLLENLY